MKTRNKLKITGLLLALVMLVTMLGSLGMTAFAEDAAVTDTAADTTYPYAVVDTAAGTVTIDGTLGGNAATDADITALVDAITGYVGSGITTITVTGSNPAIIDMGQYTSTAIGEAIYRLSGSGYEANSTYLGKIDLILSDVTEIVDYEFQDAHALNSINLPKVTTVGNNAFYHCWYLQELTFGSVVTSIKSNLAFSEVGASVDGGLCDLVLNHGQTDAAAEYQPNLLTNRWWNNFEWKRITLDHLGGVATCTAKAVCSYCAAGYGEVAPHSGGEATCTTQAVCDVCGTSYGEFAAHSFDDTTGFCNVCGSYQPAVLTTDKYDVNGDEVMDAVYEISNAGKLYWFAAVVNGGYGGVAQNKAANAVLTADIEINQDLLSSLTYDENGAVTNGTSFREWTPIGSVTNIYTGTFDGNNKTVSGLYFNDSATSYVGLFGYVGSGGTVKNVGVIDSYLSGYQGVGGVVGHNAGTVQSCYNSGTVSGSNYVGGVVGNNDGTVQNCYNTGTVSGSDYVGGVVGVNHGTVQSCYNTGTVSGSSDVGGVVGVNHDTVQSCYNTGAVTGGDYSSVGGVVGGNVGTVTNCYYNTETYTDNAIGTNGGTVDALTGGKTAAQFASGEVAYLLQAGQTAGEDGVIPEVWGQNIKTSDTDTEYDAYPTLGGATVYYGYNSCAETATAIYTNDSTVTAEKPAHSGGTATCLGSQCVVCDAWYGDVDANNHASDEFTYTANEDGTTHTKKHKCCDAVASANEEHTVTTWTQEGITHTGNCDHCGASVSGYCDKDTATGKCKVCGNLIPVLSVTSGETVTYYPNVDDVLDESASVLKSGDTVRLLDDCYGDDYLTIPEGVTFDGGNFTLNLGYFELKNNGTITGGTFEYDVTGFVSNKSTGTITGGTFICDVDNSGTITGGNFTSVTIYSAGSSISGNLTITEMLKLGLNFYPSIGEGIIDLSNATLGGGTEGADVIALDSSNLSEEWNWNSEDENVVKLKLPEGYCVLVHDYETGEDVYTETLNSETRNCYIRKHSHTLEGYGYDGDSHWTTCSCGYADKTTEAAHTPTYSASGSTITMSCDVCGANGTAAISATGKTYDGDAVEATVTKTGSLENKTIAITYAVKGGATLDGAPANAGTYTASITMGDQTVNVEFTIVRKPVTATVTLEKTSYEYTGKAIQPTVTVKDGDTTLTAGTDYDVTYGENKNAGTGTVTVTMKGNYSGSKTVEFDISKVTLTVTADNKSICIGSTYTLTYTVSGLVGSDTLTAEPTLSTEATVNTAGEYVITVSGATVSDNYAITYENGTLNVRNHAYTGEMTTTPTCTAVGEMTYTCSHDSSHTYTEEVAIDENAHAWNEGVITKQPTCTEKGVKTYTCTHDSAHTKTEEVAIDENAHAWNEGVVTTNPTCSAVGTKTYTCTHNSAHTKTEEVAIDENAHAWNEGVITKQPTCTEKGVKTYTCSHNSAHTKTEDVAIDENAHAWNNGEVTTQPTCSAVGTKIFTCTHNSEHTKTEDVAIDENAHAWNEGVITKQPTCTEKGVKTYTCTHNGTHTRTEDVNVSEHSNNAYGYCKVCQVKITGAQVSLGDDLSIKYYVKVTDTALLDLGALTMQFTMNEKTATATTYETIGGEYVFTFDGIAPQQMTDLIDVVVFAGDTAITSHDDYSIKQNCVNLLGKSADDLGLSAEKYAAMKVLIADLLSYGKAAQDYTDYTEGGYATDDVDGLTPSDAEPSESDKMVITGNTDSSLCFESATVRFDTVNYLYIKINATAEEESKVTVKVNETEYALSELVALGNGIYKISTAGLSAVQFDDILTVELSYDGTVYATLNYSVNAYTYAMNNGETENEEMKALALALYRYGKSAEAYANAQ